MIKLYFRCPACHGSQYRVSPFDVRESNPHGAVCIFCKSAMQQKMPEPALMRQARAIC